MLEEYKKKLQQNLIKVREMKEQGQKNTTEYHEVFAEMGKNFEIVKDLERQKNQIGDQIVQEEPLR